MTDLQRLLQIRVLQWVLPCRCARCRRRRHERRCQSEKRTFPRLHGVSSNAVSRRRKNMLPPRSVMSTHFSASASSAGARLRGIRGGAPNRVTGSGRQPIPSEPIKACGSSGEEIGPFRRARAFREQLAGVPVDRVAEAFLVGREVAFKHATPRPEGFDAGLDIRAHRIRHRLGRRRLGLLLKSETVDGLAKSADFDIDIFVCGHRLDRRGPEGKLLASACRHTRRFRPACRRG